MGLRKPKPTSPVRDGRSLRHLESLRHVVGVVSAVSIARDAHKGLQVAVGASMFFCRHGKAARAPYGVDTGYLQEAEPGPVDPYPATMQWSRRFIGLKVFLSIDG